MIRKIILTTGVTLFFSPLAAMGQNLGLSQSEYIQYVEASGKYAAGTYCDEREMGKNHKQSLDMAIKGFIWNFSMRAGVPAESVEGAFQKSSDVRLQFSQAISDGILEKCPRLKP